MEKTKVAIVTGANKGIGFGIVTGLCEKFDGSVYLTSRDVKRGEEAVEKLKAKGLNPLYHQLDITDDNSVNKFKDYIVTKYGGIDLLVNNAGIAFKQDSKAPFSEQAEVTVAVNYFGLIRICEALFPILRSDARVVNISSSCGHLSKIPSEGLKQRLSDKNLTLAGLSDLMNEFVEAAKEGKNTENGWGNSAYIVSKVGVSAATIIQQRNFDNEDNDRNIQVNSVHPGYVDTDMSSHKGPLTIEEGSKAALYLSLEPHGLKGQYLWHDSTVIDWYGPTIPAIY